MYSLLRYSWAILALLAVANSGHAQIQVVVSIKPVHSLVAAIMEGVGTPTLLIDAAASPHTHYLKPSHARTLESAQVIVWVGPQLESFLSKPLKVLAATAKLIELAKIPALHRLALRHTATFGDHEYDEHDNPDFDIHFWLDPSNARIIADAVTNTLIELDAANANRYRANNDSLANQLSKLETEIATVLQPVQNRPFVVLHDAYQYFEHRFSLAAIGSIIISPEVLPGAARIRQIQRKVRQLNVVCVFSEPQTESAYINLVTPGAPIRIGSLDPLGIGIKAGPVLYFDLIRAMADSMRDCLSDDG